MDGQVTFKEVKGFIQRRKKTFILIFSSVLVISALIAVLLPPIYRSQAMILIEEQQIPEEYVKSTITSYAEERLQSITRQIMSHDQLKAIVRAHDLYPELVAGGEMGEAISELKESIVIEPISSNVGKKSATVAFNLSYEGREPVTVQTVTNALAELYLAEETKAREKSVNVTSDFLQEELDGLKAQINAHELRISAFKSQHIGELPENNAANLQTVERLERELERIESRSRNLQDRLIYLKGQIANVEPLLPVKTPEGTLTRNPKERLKTLRLTLISMQSRLSDKHPDIRKIKNEIKELENQVGDSGVATEKIILLEGKKAELAALSSKYGDKHPDVKKLKRQVADLKKEVANLTAERVSVEVASELPDNPTYMNLKTQIVSAEAEIVNLRQDRSKVQMELELYRSKLSRTPVIEQEYKELTLDYDNAKKKYNEILGKLLEANVAVGMEEQQRGERFTITDQANLPTRPYKPNRLAIMLLGFVLASGLALGTTAVQEGMDHSIKTEAHLAEILGLPVLTSISLVETDEDKKARRKRSLMRAMFVMGAFALLLVVVNIFVTPLDELFQVILSRMAL
jgi:polysaccharide biosynthesis transport protein